MKEIFGVNNLDGNSQCLEKERMEMMQKFEEAQCELAKAKEEIEYLRCKCRELDRINEILQAQMDVVHLIFGNRG